MPTFSTSDFQSVARRNGNIFFNQTTNRLDVRGGSFLSRFVTWIKSKYNPAKVHQEYKMATESFIAEVKHAHNEVLRKYNGNHEVGTDDISRLYELGRQNKPLSARQVRQALKNLDIAKDALADTQAYLSPQQCNELLVKEISKHPSLAINDTSKKVDYTFGETEIEKLNSRIQEAIIEEAYRKGGVVSKTTASAIAGKFIENHIGERVKNLLSASKYFNPEHCYTQVLAKLSAPKYHKLVKIYNQNPAERNRLTSNIQEAIIKAHFSSEQGITEDGASSIAHQTIAEYADAFIKTLGEQNAATPSPSVSESDTTESLDQAVVQKESISEEVAEPSEPLRSAPNEAETEKTTAQIAEPKSTAETAERLLKVTEATKIKLSTDVEAQVRSGEIHSLPELTRAHNQFVAKKITKRSIQIWYNEKYLKTRGKPPQGMSDAILASMPKLIQSMPVFVTEKQAKLYVIQAISDYLKRHPTPS